jgi:hypothetical protein
MINGFQMTLLPANGFDQNDNFLNPSGTPYLDRHGISFVANGVDYNLFYLNSAVGYVLNIGPGSFNYVGHRVNLLLSAQ